MASTRHGSRNHLLLVAALAALTALSFVRSAGATALQLDPPSANPASPALLDRAGFPEVAGFALDQPVLGGEANPALTVGSSVSTIAQLWGHRAGAGAAFLKRLGARATFGGPTPQGDSDWPSRGHDELKHVTSELKIRVLGDEPEAREPARALRMSLGLGADTYSTGFGRDLYSGTLILESGASWIANLGYWQEEKLHHGLRDHEFKLGAGREWAWRLGSHPFETTLGVGSLIRERGHEGVRSAGARLDSPIGLGLRATASLMASNLPERSGERTVQAVLGLAYGR